MEWDKVSQLGTRNWGFPVKSILFYDDICEIHNSKPESNVIKVKMIGNKMFPLEFSCLEDSALIVNIENESYLWHLWYGHLHFIRLKLLNQKKMVVELPSINHTNKVHEGCLYGKRQWSSFLLGKSWRAKVPLDLIHADICEKMHLSL